MGTCTSVGTRSSCSDVSQDSDLSTFNPTKTVDKAAEASVLSKTVTKDKAGTGNDSQSPTKDVLAQETPATKGAATGADKQKEIWSIFSKCRWNKKDEVKRLIELYGDEAINVTDEKNGNKPIHVASQNGHTKLVKYLIDKGANPNQFNKKGNTPLHMAYEFQLHDMQDMLQKAGADPNIRNLAGFKAVNGIEGNKNLCTFPHRSNDELDLN